MSTTRLEILKFRKEWHEGMVYAIEKQMDTLHRELKMHCHEIDLVNEQINTLKQEES